MNMQTNKPALNTLEDVNATLLNIALMQLTVEKKENAMNQAIISIKQKAEPEINDLKTKIIAYEEQVNEFLNSNKKMFKEKRSAVLTYGTIGFRTGKFALEYISKKFSLEFAKQKLADLFGTKYLIVDTKIDKSKILADMKKGVLTDEKLAATGFKRVRGESSFYEINFDEIRNKVEVK